MADPRGGADAHVRQSRAPVRFRPVACWELSAATHLAPLRRDVRGVIAGAASGGAPARRLVDDVALVATELATNALRHVGPPAVVELREHRGAFLVDVADGAPTRPPVVAGRRDTGAGGFGLMITGELADAVGWYATRTTKHVWAVLLA